MINAAAAIRPTIEADGLRFDPIEHKYFLNGRQIPNVSLILDTCFPFEYSDPAALQRGTDVHLACQLDDEGDLYEEGLAPEYLPYLAAWRKFLAESGFIIDPDGIEAIRHRTIDPYAGMIDRFGAIPDSKAPNGLRRTIVDIKTGGHNKRYQIQLAAYAGLMDDPGCYQRIAVYLQPNGRYKTKIYPGGAYYRSDFAIFQSCFNIFNFKRNNGL
jgi:hypothetical protein